MSGRDLYDEQIRALEAGNLDALMAQYTEDAVLVRFDKTVSGKAAIREFMKGYMESLGSFKLISTDKFTETEDAIFFEATVESEHGQAQVYDVFMLSGNKITHQFAGVIAPR